MHIDHAGPFLGKTFLLLIDAHSKWLEIVTVPSTSSQSTIQELRKIFATHGLPETIVSDNATSYTSAEFKEFVAKNGIRHTNSTPYHPTTNRLAERAVQTFKESMNMKESTQGSLETKLARFLFHYRTTLHTTTGVLPAELLLKRKPRSHLDILKPNLSSRVQSSQLCQKVVHDRGAQIREFSTSDPVFIHNVPNASPIWLPGVIIESRGELTFYIELQNGRVVRRHIDHIRQHSCTPSQPSDVSNDILLPTSQGSTVLSDITPMETIEPRTTPFISPEESSRVFNVRDCVQSKEGGM